VPPGPDGPRKGALFGVPTAAGVQVIGMILPAKGDWNFNFDPLHWLASEGGGARGQARATRAAIAVLAGEGYYVKPEAGVEGPSIEAVYHFWRWRNYGHGTVDTGSDFVLFKNGEFWRNPGAGPRDIDADRFKEARWYDWGTWAKRTDGILVTLNGHQPELLSFQQLKRYEPATGASQRVEGFWKWSKMAVTSADSFVQNTKTMRLHADGRFERDGFAWSNPSLGREALRNPNGAHFRGHYRINGYTLNLDYDDGTKVSDFFYWAGGASNTGYDMCLINGASWLGGLAH